VEVDEVVRSQVISEEDGGPLQADNAMLYRTYNEKDIGQKPMGFYIHKAEVYLLNLIQIKS